MVKAIMFQGTGSDVGKSVLVAGLCRLMANRGVSVRPFKPQNMSNNAAVADDGLGEIGRAQALQAIACRVDSTIDMNPVLLKPQSDNGSQIIVQGKVWGAAKGRDYQKLKGALLERVLESYVRVKNTSDLVLVEGAGSPAEINLRKGDIANMGFARAADVPVVLIGDIDRGGVIASLVGTHAILDPQDCAMVKGYLINKFRGDVSLFDEGLSAISKYTGWPSFGVVPWLQDARYLPAEDSVVLDHAQERKSSGIKIAIAAFSRIANFDDFDPLVSDPMLDVEFVRPGTKLPDNAVLIIIPGSKSTIADMEELRVNGWDKQIISHYNKGGHVLGICGGYQMLGNVINDPDCIEGQKATIDGIGILDVSTTMAGDKRVQKVSARSNVVNHDIQAYEIHMGITVGADCARSFAMIGNNCDGAISKDGLVMGSYLHGMFVQDDFRHAFLKKLGIVTHKTLYFDQVNNALDAIAHDLERSLSIDSLLQL